MSCFGGPKSSTEPIANLDKYLCAYVHENAAPTFCDRLLRKYRLEVQWSYVDHSSTLTSFKVTEKHGSNSKIESRKMCLFKTEFTNNTENVQNYTFKTERQTKSCAKVSVQKSFSIGGNLNVSFGIPSGPPLPGVDPLNITGGLSSTLQITKSKENTFEEGLTWSVDSTVAVKKNSRTTASLIIEEEKATATFEIKHTLIPKESTIPVFVVHKKTGTVVKSHGIPSEKFANILKDVTNVRPLPNTVGVEVITEGICDVCYGAKQIISINERPYYGPQDSIIVDDLIPAPPIATLHSSSPVSTSMVTTLSDDNINRPLLQKQTGIKSTDKRI